MENKYCSIDICNNKPQSGGKCIKHGGKRIYKKCSTDCCTNNSKMNGVCIKHGAISPKCTIVDCTNQSQKFGVCTKHGAVTKKICFVNGCMTQSKMNGVCVKHGAISLRCSVDTCTNKSVKLGVCVKHGAITKRCLFDTCDKQSKKDHFCIKHNPNYIPPDGKISKGEQKIIELLETLNIEYLFDLSFENLKGLNGGKLRFDFRIPDRKGGYLFIEFDGKQHFEEVKHWGGLDALLTIQAHDEIKNNFCSKNDWPMLRIKYTETNKIKQMIVDFINNYSTLIQDSLSEVFEQLSLSKV